MTCAIAAVIAAAGMLLLILAVVNSKDCREPDKVVVLDDLCSASEKGDKITGYFGKSNFMLSSILCR